jgi:uncharacterized protein with PIN domain
MRFMGVEGHAYRKGVKEQILEWEGGSPSRPFSIGRGVFLPSGKDGAIGLLAVLSAMRNGRRARCRNVELDPMGDSAVTHRRSLSSKRRWESVANGTAETALSAFARYGKGRGHPAQLNLGDCFAYAVAKNHRRVLLFKGDDFDKTEIRVASRT